ncbi:NAD-dependent epimerase/dehydratase family protein, partial [Thiohalospira sp.]|uniref:NAD-dependent epimerase/dehydratase family protein n=1 Tax=Thiohalospira sp. TaxID=3080549 RepID=UPI00397F58A1
DLDRGGDAQRPEPGGTLYWFAPPPPRGRRDPRLRDYLAGIPAGAEPARVVLISTSAVYGDRGGEWIDEEAPLRPSSDRGHRRLDAERALTDWAGKRGVEATLLRVAGIYGPGRLPLERLERGEPILDPADSGVTNRIHAEDLAAICARAGEPEAPAGVYNVADGAPCPMAEYFDAVADAAGLPRPPRVPLTEAHQRITRGMLDFLLESRRLDTRRLHRELGVELAYPDYVEGIRASLAAMAAEP